MWICGTKRSMFSDNLSLKLFHITSTLLRLFAHIPNLSRRRVCRPKTSVFYLRYTTISFAFKFQYYLMMITDPLHCNASGKRTIGPDKVNMQQCIPLVSIICYLSEPVFPYQTIYKCLRSTITTCVSIPICLR